MRTKVRILFIAAVALCLALCLPSLLLAQEATGRIVGQIMDPQGAVVPGVRITITNVATRIASQTVSDKDGLYQAPHLPIGSYTVTAEGQGFQKLVTVPYTLEINQTLRVDLKLQVGTTKEIVEVTGDTAQVETYNATLGYSVTSRPVVNMPLNGRNVLDLAKLEPGVTEENKGHDGAGTFSVAGGRLDSVTYLLDGGVNNSLLDNDVVFNPNPDTVAEFRILESNYSAEYGRNGGGIISVVTKSGTNQWHGSAFEFLRNDALNANSFFNKRTGLPREVLKRNQFGGTFGGPIRKDKAFFFFGYQGQRLSQQENPGPRIGWTDRELSGDFSQSAGRDAVANFLTANNYFQSDPALAAQGIIDPSKINPVSQKYIAAGLIPHSPTGTISTQAAAADNRNEWTGKLDFSLSSKDRLSVGVGVGRTNQLCPYAQNSCDPNTLDTTIPFPVTRADSRYFLNLAYTRNFSLNVLNELRITAQRLNSLRYKPSKQLPTAKDLGIGTTPDQSTGPPELYFYDSGDWLGFSYRGPTDLVNNTFSYADTLSWVKGKHTLKFGGSFTPFQNNTLYDYYVNGEFDFYGSGTGAGTGAEFADFLLGIPDEYYQWPSAPSNIRTKYYSGFAQDEWRVNKHLVLTLGLRYEYSSPKLDTLGRSFTIVPGAQSTRFINAPVGLLFPGDKGAPRGANYPDRNDFAPRFGFAWDPTGTGRTSVRGGFGVFYDILKGEDSLQFNGQAPFFGYTDFNFSPPSNGEIPYFTDPFGSTGTVNPFPSKPPAPDINFADSGFLPFGGGGVYFVDPHLRTPYIFQYNLSVQHELTRSLRAEAAYVGSGGRKLTSLVDINPFILGTATRVLNTQPGTDSGTWSYTETFRNVANQSYNSLQASLKKQISNHRYFGSSYFTLAYTWSKSIDNSSGFRQAASDEVPYYNPGLFRAVSDIDIPHRITFSGGWDLPFADFMPSVPKKITQGWSVYPIVTWRGGFPLDISAHLPHTRRKPGPSGVGDSHLVHVNLVGNSVATFDPKAQTDPGTMGAIYFNPSNFEWASLDALNGDWTPPAPDQRTYGTLPRNFFRGPSRSNLDFAIAKTTPLVGERMKLEFRAEFFNLFNGAQFDNPTSAGLNPNSSLFGEITTTADPRIIQFGLRLTF
jgi:outer membrane receptor protein involved in Fe transport